MLRSTNRFFYEVFILLKRVFSLFVLLSFVISSASCSAAKDIIKDNPQDTIIGYVSFTVSETAAKTYAANGVSLVGYNTLGDLVLAVENGKVDYGLLADYEYTLAINSQRDIKLYETCDYKVDFCAYFRNEDVSLFNRFNESVKDMKQKGIIEKIKLAEYNGNTYNSSYLDEGDEKLTILCTPYYERFIYFTDNGLVKGIDVNIAEEFAAANNYLLSFDICEKDDMFFALENGEGDMILSATEFTEERAENYLASDIYNSIEFYLVTRTIY